MIMNTIEKFIEQVKQVSTGYETGFFEIMEAVFGNLQGYLVDIDFNLESKHYELVDDGHHEFWGDEEDKKNINSLLKKCNSKNIQWFIGIDRGSEMHWWNFGEYLIGINHCSGEIKCSWLIPIKEMETLVDNNDEELLHARADAFRECLPHEKETFQEFQKDHGRLESILELV